MTFAVGLKIQADRTTRLCDPGRGATALRPRAGFTLLELTLAMAIVLLLLGAFVVNYTGYQGSRRLADGVDRFGTVLRMARAEAASIGRRLRLSFDEETAQMQVLWEPEPLTEPGQFVRYHACTWRHYLPTGTVRVSRCQLVGSSAYRVLAAESLRDSAFEEEALEAITFYPDGSSDSAVIELVASRDDPDEAIPRAVIQLDGLNGTIKTDFLTPDDVDVLESEGVAGLEAGETNE